MLIVANYKMNGNLNLYKSILKQINRVKDTKLVLCPPFVFLPLFKKCLKFHALGAQDVGQALTGKCTGQISTDMLKEFGCEYTLVGHSERRVFESDDIVADKIKSAQSCDLTPIVCVGETNRGEGYAGFKHQVESALKVADKTKPIIIAYEPVWAIGTGEIPTAEYIEKMVKNIKNTAKKFKINLKVLYGGSVDEQNYVGMLNTGIDGFLIGGLSLKIEKFIKFVRGVYGK